MTYLYQALTQRVDAWRAANYPCEGFPAIREILEFATEDGEATQVFNVALADVPERKQDLVNGQYELPAPPAGSTAAVKIIDMLGEELIVTVVA